MRPLLRINLKRLATNCGFLRKHLYLIVKYDRCQCKSMAFQAQSAVLIFSTYTNTREGCDSYSKLRIQINGYHLLIMRVFPSLTTLLVKSNLQPEDVIGVRLYPADLLNILSRANSFGNNSERNPVTCCRIRLTFSVSLKFI